MRPWKTRSRRTLLDMSPWLSVASHVVELPDGQLIEDWPWLEGREFVNVVAVTETGSFLVFRQTKYAVAGTTLAPVGGYLDAGEAKRIARAWRRSVIEAVKEPARVALHGHAPTVDHDLRSGDRWRPDGESRPSGRQRRAERHVVSAFHRSR